MPEYLDSEEFLQLWISFHGELNAELKSQFINRKEVKSIIAYPAFQITMILSRSRFLDEILANLENSKFSPSDSKSLDSPTHVRRSWQSGLRGSAKFSWRAPLREVNRPLPNINDDTELN